MKINSIILNVLFIIILICLIYFFIYLNNSNFENFNIPNPVKPVDSSTVQTSGTTPIDNVGSNVVSSLVEIPVDVPIYNGYDHDTPLKHSQHGNSIVDTITTTNIPKYIDGYYWINIQDRGPKYIYCIMDKAYDDGCWMLAMRSTSGSRTFHYESNHFKKATTLNDSARYIKNEIIDKLKLNNVDLTISSIGNHIYDTDSGEFDAKFETFNYTKAYEWMAIFYVKVNGEKILGGDFPNKRGWVWTEKNVKIQTTRNDKTINKFVSPLKLFNYLDNQTDRSRYLVDKYKVNFANSLSKFSNKNAKNLFSSLLKFNKSPETTSFYGINYYNNNLSNRDISKMRWGFNFNDKDDKYNNAFSGIGSRYYSAGNFESYHHDNPQFVHKPPKELINNMKNSYAVEWYVREKKL